MDVLRVRARSVGASQIHLNRKSLLKRPLRRAYHDPAATSWVTLKALNAFRGECPRRVFDSDRGILRKSFAFPCEDLTLCRFFSFRVLA